MYMSAVVYILAYGVARQTRNCSYTISFPLFSSKRISTLVENRNRFSLTEYQGVGCLAWLSFSFATCYWCIYQTAAPVLRRPCAILAFEPRTLLLNIFFFFFGEQKKLQIRCASYAMQFYSHTTCLVTAVDRNCMSMHTLEQRVSSESITFDSGQPAPSSAFLKTCALLSSPPPPPKKWQPRPFTQFVCEMCYYLYMNSCWHCAFVCVGVA